MNVCERMKRRKEYHYDTAGTKRNLGIYKLIALGLGGTLGQGIYVLTGQVARVLAGPAVTICVIIAAVVSFLGGICYAELSSRVPYPGSAYVYSYMFMGEFVAFTVGWSMLLEYMTSMTSAARALSSYLDALLDYRLSHAFKNIVTINIAFMANYLDFLSLGLILLAACVIAFGVKKSFWLNLLFIIVNLITISLIIIPGCTQSNIKNWQLPASAVIEDAGSGGFFPFDYKGILKGAAICFFGFVGFDCITSTAGAAIDPTHNIPLAIFGTMLIVFGTYCLLSIILTLMIPYYLINPQIPLTSAFKYHKMYKVQVCVTVGSVFALCASLLNSMFPLQRAVRAMAQDGFMFKGYASIRGWTVSSMLATFLLILVAACCTLILHFDYLIELSVIGVMLDYTIVAIGVVMLHYKDDSKAANVIDDAEGVTYKMIMHQICKMRTKGPSNDVTQSVTRVVLTIFVALSTTFSLAIKYFVISNEKWSAILAACIAVLSIVCMIIIGMQPKSTVYPPFKTPFVPLIPCLSIWINIFLVLTLSWLCCVIYLGWMILGYFTYFGIISADFLGRKLTSKRAKQLISSFKFLV